MPEKVQYAKNQAKEAGLSRNAIYNHPSVYQHILMCRTKEEERIQQLERKKYAE